MTIGLKWKGLINPVPCIHIQYPNPTTIASFDVEDTTNVNNAQA
jgi:hypothetical protein